MRVCLYSGLTYQACEVHAPRYVAICGLYKIFPHYPLNGAIFGEKHNIVVLIFSTSLA